jgi:DNA polymerase III sliding clamp (beta) subunit (PCNA family)
MRLRAEAKLLTFCTARMSRMLDPKGPAPLRCILIEAEPGAVSMTVMSAATVTRLRLNLEVIEGGRALVSADRLLSALDGMGDQEITLTSDGLGLAASRGRRRLTAPGLDPAEYPRVPTLKPEAVALTVPSEALAGVLKLTRHAAGTDPEKAFAYGVRLIQTDGRLLAMATDGQRGAMASVQTNGPDLDVFVIQPALREVTGWMSERVRIAHDGERVELACANASVSWRTLGPVPWDLRGYFNDLPSCRLEMPRKEFLGAVTAVSKVARQDQVSSYRLVLCASPEGEVHLSASVEGATATDGLEARVLEGRPTGERIGLNGEFLSDVLEASLAGVVEVGLADPLSPFRIRTPDLDAVLMPIRLVEEAHG